MAQQDLTSNDWILPLQDEGGNPSGFMEVGRGTSTRFTVLVLEVSGVSYYYWPNSSGALRYGTTAPTTSTQDSAGSAV